jgi:hypothetical protein
MIVASRAKAARDRQPRRHARALGTVALAGECGWLQVEGDRRLVNDQHNPE